MEPILEGDCLDSLAALPAASVDLIVTSPPYADKRKTTYGGVNPEEYVDWFLPRSAEMLRVLKPTGSFVLNIKEGVTDGERQTYVYELVIALRKQGWRYVDDYIWTRPNGFPGRWPNRFANRWGALFPLHEEQTVCDVSGCGSSPTDVF
jgi:site-specific DNA-methyltransferase (adenine-specific)